MRIYRHHTAVDVIDLDDRTGRWTPVEADEGNPIIVGLMPIDYRADFEIRGSYAIENDRRFCFGWNEEGELVFRTDERRFVLFRRAPDGRLLDAAPDLHVALRPASGDEPPGTSTFTLSDGDGRRRVEVSYDAMRYRILYGSNFTFVPDEDLSDWDFFVHVERGIAELRILAHADESEPVLRTGEPAPHAGIWAAVGRLGRRWYLEAGEAAPAIDGDPVCWVRMPEWKDEN